MIFFLSIFVLFNLYLDGQAVADIIRTTLGPRSMLKMLLDASGGKDYLFFQYIHNYIYAFFKRTKNGISLRILSLQIKVFRQHFLSWLLIFVFFSVSIRNCGD